MTLVGDISFNMIVLENINILPYQWTPQVHTHTKSRNKASEHSRPDKLNGHLQNVLLHNCRTHTVFIST